MEEGNIINNKENDTEKVNFMGAAAICKENVDVIIPDEEVQPGVIIPEIHLLQDQSKFHNFKNRLISNENHPRILNGKNLI